MRDRDTAEIRILEKPELQAIELVRQSPYIRLIDSNGIRRVSRRVALQAIEETTRCKDCKDTGKWCDACKCVDNPLSVFGWFIYLDGTMSGPILHC